MSLNNIILNNRLLCQLYPDTLLETEVKLVPESAQVPVAATVQHAVPANNNTDTPLLNGMAAVPNIAAAASAPAALEPVVAYGNTPSLGGNKKGILVLVNNEQVPYLPDAELEFLSSILSACKLGISDVAIVNLYLYPQPYTELIQQFNARQILLLGITPQQLDLPFHFPHFQLQQFDGRTYLSALPLGEIAQNRDLKMQLWGCLKALFGI